MNNLGRFTFVIFIGFLSCDGRDRMHKSSEEVLIENRLMESFSENIKYFPETYSEIETDTILSNGFRVNIKAYTDMERFVSFSKVKDTIKYTKKYRNFKFEIFVEKEGSIVYNEIFDKELVNQKLGYRDDFHDDSPFYNFNKLAVLKSIYVDNEPSLKDKVLVDIVYSIPITKRIAKHTMYIYENGETGFVTVQII